jgi:DNA modification methylase
VEIRDRIKELRRVKAAELLPNPKNWRRHPKAQADALRGILAEVGYADALLARELPDGKLILVDGHLRAETTPSSMVPVLILDVTEEEADKILLTLDPLAAMAEADADSVKALLGSVHSDSDAVKDMLERLGREAGIPSSGLLQEPPAQIDKAAELKAKWGTETGQLWQVGPSRLLCADCREKADVARLWRDGGQKFRMVWTDPPYGVDYAGKNEYLNRGDRGNRIQKQIENDRLSADECQALFSTALTEAQAWAMPGAVCYATVPSGPLLVRFIAGFYEGGFDFRHLLVWVKQQFVIGMSDYHYRHEPILYGWRPNGPHYFVKDRSQSTIFEVDKPHVSDLHPTTKPVELIARMIENSSRQGEIVYDPFSGSGSTLLAAHQLGRIGYGVEIDPGYVAVTLERLVALGLKPDLVDAHR